MKYAVIDTEGSGLFDFTKPADAPGQPRLASLHMILLKDDLTIEEEYGALIKPDGWEMSAEVTAINGLTNERLMAEGKPVDEVLAVYSQAIKEGFVIVAYNAQHDCKQLRAALRRAGMPDLFEQTKNICVMRAAKGIIPRPDGKSSWPKLDHCRAFLGLSADGAHTAKVDAHAALAVLLHLISAGVNLVPDVHYAKERPDAKERPVAAATDAVMQAMDDQTAPISRPRAPVPPLAEQEIPE